MVTQRVELPACDRTAHESERDLTWSIWCIRYRQRLTSIAACWCSGPFPAPSPVRGSSTTDILRTASGVCSRSLRTRSWRSFCLRHGIALWDVIAECDIEGASDTSIRNAKPNKLSLITGHAPIEAVYCTGAKAHQLYRKLGCEQECGLPATRLPSTSPANAACGMDRLLEAYAAIFEHAIA